MAKAVSNEKRTSLAKAAKQLSVAEQYYARLICSMSSKTRLKIYRKLASLLHNRFSLMDALERVHNIITNNGKKPNEPMALALASWSKNLSNGQSFSEALKGFAPNRERLMLSVGDVSDLESALNNLIKVAEGSAKMIGPIISALAYPAFLVIMTVAVVYAIGAYMVPPMIEAAPDTIWRGVAKDVVGLSNWIIKYWALAFAVPPTLFIIIYFTLGNWTGFIRVIFDRFPPWSIYRVFTGVCWLLALAALVKAGTPVSIALRSLRADSNRYLRERIDKALVYVNNGDNLGDALFKTETGFPDEEIIGDLRIYSELDNFEAALDQMANDWLEESVTGIADRAALLNTIAILMVSGVIAWAVMGVFEMQNQITNSMK
ncbi:MAG: type II secretion system F family protein [Alphaproteobacteria bacterium]